MYGRICVAAAILLGLGAFITALPQSGTLDAVPPANRYVNAKQCAGCHPAIARTYSLGAMAHSFYRLTAATSGQDFANSNDYYHSASDTHYTMFRRGDEFYQRRYQIGQDGLETNADEKRIDFVMGSGAHAKTYLHLTARGALHELPVGWYAEKGGYWAMSPGYDSPRHPGAQRPIGYDCMFCHNSYPQVPQEKDHFGDTPRFTGNIPEGIDCQRCHGPGQQHVAAAQRAGESGAVIRDAILNPARLSLDRQMEVCMQCHLQPNSLHPTENFKRYGRGYFSYDPAEPLSQFMIFFDTAARARPERFQIAGSAFRLRQSACFLKSAGKLQCITCHNPHDVRHGAEAGDTYNKICQGCHRTVPQAAISGRPHPAATNCIDCHMPKRRTEDVVNVVMTDHYIQRRAPAGDRLADITENHSATLETPAEAIPYYPGKLRLNAEDRLTMAVAQIRDNTNLTAGIPRLVRVLEIERPKHPDPYFELAEAFRKKGKQADAARWYREALRLDPYYLPALIALSKTLVLSGQWSQAEDTLQKAMRLAPADSRIAEAMGELEAGQNNPAKAIASLRQAISLDPDAPAPRNVLGIVLARSGKIGEAEIQFREAIRDDPNLVEPHANLADLLAARGELKQAAGEFEQLVRLEPENISLRLKYATLLYMLRDDDKAIGQARAAVGIQPRSAEAHHVLGNILERRKELRAAMKEYQTAVSLDPANDRARLDLGAVLVQRGNKAAAIPHLKAASASKDARIRQIAAQLWREAEAQ